MFGRVDGTSKDDFLEHTRAERKQREQRVYLEICAVKIQALYRGYIERKHQRQGVRDHVDRVLCMPADGQPDHYSPQLMPAIELYSVVRQFLSVMKTPEDSQRFEFLCRFILVSMGNENLKVCYASLALTTSHVMLWVGQLKTLMTTCCHLLAVLKPEKHIDARSMAVYLRVLVTFTSTSGWTSVRHKAGDNFLAGLSQVCNNVMGHLVSGGLYHCLQILLMNGLARLKPVFSRASLSAVCTIAMRPLLGSNFSDSVLTKFILHILSVPALFFHLSSTAPESLDLFARPHFFCQCLKILMNEQTTQDIFSALEGNYTLCLMANLIDFGNKEMEGVASLLPDFATVLIRLLEKCKSYVRRMRSNLTHWHPVFGWFSQPTDQKFHQALPHVLHQLRLLWSRSMIHTLFSPIVDHLEAGDHQAVTTRTSHTASPTTSTVPPVGTPTSKNVLRKVFEKALTKGSEQIRVHIDSSVFHHTCLSCVLYQMSLSTLTELRTDILAGLSYTHTLPALLWQFLCNLGPDCGLKCFMDLLLCTPHSTQHASLFSLLSLFSEATSHLLITLDNFEMFEQQQDFSIADYKKMSEFMNLFVFKVVWNGLIDVCNVNNDTVFINVLNLLTILHSRDARHSFTSSTHWHLRDIKPVLFVSELEKGRKSAEFLLKRAPHILPFNVRVILFKKNVAKERETLGLLESSCSLPPSTLITVHRSRIVEDGYRQLAQLSVRSLKCAIRVKFVNEQGLDEAGIDQDGVFKEFLEEIIQKVFNPGLNLFKVTSDQRLYPSSTSYIQDNHLSLFEFVGKMLAKAVYEGIVVDVLFAPFFLTQMLCQHKGAVYSLLDELPSFDADLAKSLSFIKHYSGDVSDLDLTFTCDEDCMGQVMTHELIPGGGAMVVSNDNRIRYVHLMAHFRMCRQIREQTAAFVTGFRSVVDADWLALFSAPELQQVIAGDIVQLDLDDLRRHTVYYGGYHNNHRVIKWLWKVVKTEFSAKERSLFLKFVTSCSKPPLLGFAHLEPPFSVRCVEVCDDQDTGDTVASVLKGFFNIKRKEAGGRLPTSSTCFNLLKLPNYASKSVLRDKLRYAVNSHSGFEIS